MKATCVCEAVGKFPPKAIGCEASFCDVLQPGAADLNILPASLSPFWPPLISIYGPCLGKNQRS